MDKIRVIMTGPMPPSVGGMTTVLTDLAVSKLNDRVDLVFFNTAKTTREKRTLFEAILSKSALWLDWVKLIKNSPNTIAHIHTCSGFTFFLDGILICLARFFGVPVILHIHGAKFDKFLDSLNPILLFLVKWLCRRCKFIIALSDSWKLELLKRLGEQSFTVVENGVPIKKECLQKNEGKNLVNVLFLGNLTERKGILDLLAVMPNIDRAILHIVGGEEQQGMVETVTRLIMGSSLKDRVIYHGVKHGKDKQQFLQEADIFVLPSYAEGLPIALLEAMSYGLPAIVSNVGGIPTVVTNEREGFLISAGNQQELLAALIKLVNDSGLREQMGEAARKRCIAQFSIDVVADKLLALYLNIFPELASFVR